MVSSTKWLRMRKMQLLHDQHQQLLSHKPRVPHLQLPLLQRCLVLQLQLPRLHLRRHNQKPMLHGPLRTADCLSSDKRPRALQKPWKARPCQMLGASRWRLEPRLLQLLLTNPGPAGPAFAPWCLPQPVPTRRRHRRRLGPRHVRRRQHLPRLAPTAPSGRSTKSQPPSAWTPATSGARTRPPRQCQLAALAWRAATRRSVRPSIAWPATLKIAHPPRHPRREWRGRRAHAVP